MEINERVVDTLMSGIEEIAHVHAVHSLTMKFHRINENILKRIFTKGKGHHLTHTYEAVKWNAIRRSFKKIDKKPTAADLESRLSLNKLPIEDEPSDDSVFTKEDVLYRKPEIASSRMKRMQSSTATEEAGNRISVSSSGSRRSHPLRTRPLSMGLRSSDHYVHFPSETSPPTSPTSPNSNYFLSKNQHGQRRSTVSGRRVVSNMFAQSSFYHLPRRDSLVLPSTPVEVIPPSERRPSSTLYSLDEGDVDEKTNL